MGRTPRASAQRVWASDTGRGLSVVCGRMSMNIYQLFAATALCPQKAPSRVWGATRRGRRAPARGTRDRGGAVQRPEPRPHAERRRDAGGRGARAPACLLSTYKMYNYIRSILRQRHRPAPRPLRPLRGVTGGCDVCADARVAARRASAREEAQQRRVAVAVGVGVGDAGVGQERRA